MKEIIETRILLAIRLVDQVRTNIVIHGGKYSGQMKPNLQSVIDILTIPDSVLSEQLKTIPKEFLPKPEYYGQLSKAWEGLKE